MIEYAKKYKDAGLDCLPCKQDKSPYLLTANDTWDRNFGFTEFENVPAIGIKCGIASGNLECIDIDNHQGTAKENLTAFIDQIKELYEKYKFPIESTQSGGYHFIYRCEEIEGNQKLAQVPVWNDQIKKFRPDAIFETRGNNGYFVAYPSLGYKVVKNDIFTIPTITKEERKYIIQICKSFNKFYEVKKDENEKDGKPGDIYNNDASSIDEMINILTSVGWSYKGKRWTRPGKKKGISATLGEVADNVFYVFTANAYPFEPMKGYTPFQVKALIEFNGDFKECAKVLAEKLGINSNQKNTYKKQEHVKPQMTVDEKHLRLQKAFINTDIEIEKPPVILYISETEGYQNIRKRLFTLGNFSAIIGKAKSRKTFNLSLLTGAMINGYSIYNKFYACLPDDKRQIMYFDTEQGLYDSSNVVKRMERLARLREIPNFVGFNIREYSPLDRCQIIEDALELYPQVGFIGIDGIADLAKAINDEEEATRVTGLLLRWTKQYNCHISTILHQNKNDNFATGHLGSSVMKKAEIVMSVTKDTTDPQSSIVSCDFSRGIDFKDYKFYITDTGLPEIVQYDLEETKPDRYYD